MRILVVGGAGFIGTNIAKEAVSRGHDVVIFDSLMRNLSEQNIGLVKADFVRGDIRVYQDLELINGKVDAIINLAANAGVPISIRNPLYDFQINAMGALNVLEYSRRNGKVPVIFASTNKIYSEEINELPFIETETRYEWTDKDYLGINENFPMDSRGKYPHSPYGASKASADLYHQEYFHIYDVPTVINRMSCIYGYYQKGVADQGWIDHFIRQIAFKDGRLEIYGSGKQVRDMLWGGDVARLYLDELENIDKTKGQVFNVGGGINNTLSINEAITHIEALTGKKAKLTYYDKRQADQDIYITDISKVTKTLDWTPTVNPTMGIKLMLEKYIRGYEN